jgi:hypothetical protein
MSLPLALIESRSKETGTVTGEMTGYLLQEVKITPRNIKRIITFLTKNIELVKQLSS